MNILGIIAFLLGIAYFIFPLRMYQHILANQPERKWSWLFIFYFTFGLASIYYYFAYKQPKDLEKKKFRSNEYRSNAVSPIVIEGTPKKIFFTTIPNRWKAIYLIWLGIHLTLFLLSGNFLSKMNQWNEAFFPFWNNYFARPAKIDDYDLIEFIFYLIIPIIIYAVIRLWKKKD